MNQKNNKFIKDPIYGIIEIEQEYAFIYDLIQTKEMKRLKNIIQLGECFNVFYSAVHSRLTHSLGVFRNAKKIIENLKVDINYEDRKIILSAALLHDIGHGPRSHCFEKWTNHNHERMTTLIITDPNTEVNQVLRKYDIDPNKVMDIINHNTSNHKQYYFQIVSSQIDADRLDYLLRDSYFTGARYGSNIDIDILLKWISVENNQIVFDKKAIGLIEELLFARAQMFKHVYAHKKVICYQYLLGQIFARFKTLKLSNYQFKDKYNLYYLLDPYIKDEQWDIPTFLAFDDNKLNIIIQSWNEEEDEILKDLTNNYLFINNYYVTNERTSSTIDEYVDNFKFYNCNEAIYIRDNDQIINFLDINDNSSLITKQNFIKYTFYIAKN